MEFDELAPVTDMGSYIARKIHAEEMSQMRQMRATNQLGHYDRTCERLQKEYGTERPLRLVRPILKLVIAEDLQ